MRWRWLAWALLLAALAPIVVAGVTYVRFATWRAQHVRALEAASRVVETARGPIEYARVGQGPPALLLHASPGGYDSVLQVVELDQAEGRPVELDAIIPSRPGYLRTPLGVGRSPAEQADAYAALLDRLDVGSVVVIASSGGAPSAIEFALRHPQRCRALVLQSAVLRREAPEAPAEGAGRLIGAVANSDFGRWLLARFFVDDLQEQAGGDPFAARVGWALTYASMPIAARRAGDDNDQAQFAKLRDLPFSQVRCPTLIVHGTADDNEPFANAAWAQRQIPGARLVAVEGAGHLVGITHRREVRAATDAFLAPLLTPAAN
jgi:pimeloyl-ACP methyl ester carboxylesterase